MRVFTTLGKAHGYLKSHYLVAKLKKRDYMMGFEHNIGTGVVTIWRFILTDKSKNIGKKY